MQVETYEEKEVTTGESASELAEQGERALLLEQLGLAGQQAVSGEASHGYRLITAEEKVVFETLFPQKTTLYAYSDSVIPLRVLQVAAHVKSLDRVDMTILEVWHPAKGVNDPVLVARADKWNSDIYLLARWGSPLETFEQLRKKAAAIVKRRLLTEKAKALSALNALEVSDEQIERAFDEGKVPSIVFYVS